MQDCQGKCRGSDREQEWPEAWLQTLTRLPSLHLSLNRNDDNGAMATLLLFHLLGIYPVPGSSEYLIVSPFLPSYTLNNSELGKLTVTAKNFDNSTLAEKIPSGARAYVNSVSINGVKQSSRCKIQVSCDSFEIFRWWRECFLTSHLCSSLSHLCPVRTTIPW